MMIEPQSKEASLGGCFILPLAHPQQAGNMQPPLPRGLGFHFACKSLASLALINSTL